MRKPYAFAPKCQQTILGLQSRANGQIVKSMRKNFLLKALLAIALCAPVAISTVSLVGCGGCITSQQTTAIKSLASVEATTVSTYDAFCQNAIIESAKGPTTATNRLPQVSQAFNLYQMGARAALAAALGNSNSVAPPSVQSQSQTVLNLIKGQ